MIVRSLGQSKTTMGGMTKVSGRETPYRKILSAVSIGLGTKATPNAQLMMRNADDQSARLYTQTISVREHTIHQENICVARTRTYPCFITAGDVQERR